MPCSIIIDKAGDWAPWLVMVHGMSHDHRFFSAQTPCFEPSHRILLVDLPGHGMMAAATGPFGPEEYAAGVLSALDDAGINKLTYWGTHTGAGVALMLALRQPDRFQSLVLEGPVVPGSPPPYVAERLDAARRTARGQGVQPALVDWFEQSVWFDVMRKNPERCRETENRAMVMEFSAGPWLDDTTAKPLRFEFEALAQLRCPVLLINGEHDHPDFVDVAIRLEEILPNATRATIPDAGGFPTWEFPGRVNAEVGRFLKRPG